MRERCDRPSGPCPADGRAAEMAGDRLGRVLAALPAGEAAWTSARLCGACPGLAGVTGAGMMLMSGEVHRGTLSASDEVSRLMEELQYTLGEGPCVDAYRQDRVVAEPDLAGPLAGRWPAFGPAALRAGARAVFGFPLQVGTVRLGALNLYRDRPGPLSGEQHADMLVLAGVAARWVLQAQAGRHPGRWPGSWKPAPTCTSRCTTRQGSSRSRRASASRTRWSGCARSRLPMTAGSPTWPGT